MKSIKTLIVAFVAVLSLASCKKDKEIELTTAQKIQAKWSVVSIISTEIVPPTTNQTITYNGKPTDYFDFRADGKLYVKEDGDDHVEEYIINSNTQITIGDDVYTIQKLDNHSLTLYKKTVLQSGGYFEDTFNFSR